MVRTYTCVCACESEGEFRVHRGKLLLELTNPSPPARELTTENVDCPGCADGLRRRVASSRAAPSEGKRRGMSYDVIASQPIVIDNVSSRQT